MSETPSAEPAAGDGVGEADTSGEGDAADGADGSGEREATQAAAASPEPAYESAPEPAEAGTDAESTAEPATSGVPAEVAASAPEQGDLAAAPWAEGEAIPQTGLGTLQSGGLGALVLLLLVIVRRVRRVL